jgi:hypothetical protein
MILKMVPLEFAASATRHGIVSAIRVRRNWVREQVHPAVESQRTGEPRFELFSDARLMGEDASLAAACPYRSVTIASEVLLYAS